MNKEIWKDIPDYEGIYQVSNCGRVKSLKRKTNNQYGKKDTILKPQTNGNYLKIVLSKNGKTKSIFIHRIVALCFIENPNEYNIVNHLDNNPKNNIYTNLEWTSYAGNMQHCIKQGRFADNKRFLQHEGFGKKKVKRIEGNNEIIYSCLKDTEKDGFIRQHVRDCCNKKLKTHKGYVWEWV